jgi:hypothetical protein
MPSDRPFPTRLRAAFRTGRAVLLFGSGLALALAGPIEGRAQTPNTPEPEAGYWWALTVGAGSTRFTCDLCTLERDTGPWAGLAIGASASDAVKVGVEGGFWTHLDDGTREWLYRAGVVAHVYPRVGSGLHLIGGAGWSAYRAEEIRHDAGRLTVGLGWDLPLTSGWLVGNSITLDAASFGSLKNDQVTIDRDVGVSVLRIGVYLKHR